MSEEQVSGVARFFRIVTRGQSYLSIAYLLLSFPLGVLYFVVLVTGLSLGLGLLVIFVGLFVLLGLLLLVRLFIVWERGLATAVLGVRFKVGQTTERPVGMLNQLKALVADPVTWKGLAFLLAKFPIGIASFTIVVTLLSVALVFVAAPFLYQIPGANYNIGDLFVVDTMSEAGLLSVLGAFVFVGSLHAFRWFAWVLGRFARIMLQ